MLPPTTARLVLQWNYLTEFQTANNEFKDQQKNNSNGNHCVYNLSDIPDHHDVSITTDGQTTLAGLSEGYKVLGLTLLKHQQVSFSLLRFILTYYAMLHYLKI